MPDTTISVLDSEYPAQSFTRVDDAVRYIDNLTRMALDEEAADEAARTAASVSGKPETFEQIKTRLQQAAGENVIVVTTGDNGDARCFDENLITDAYAWPVDYPELAKAVTKALRKAGADTPAGVTVFSYNRGLRRPFEAVTIASFLDEGFAEIEAHPNGGGYTLHRYGADVGYVGYFKTVDETVEAALKLTQ